MMKYTIINSDNAGLLPKWTGEITFQKFDWKRSVLCMTKKKPSSPSPKRSFPEVPITQKELLTLREATAYTGIGINKLREMSNDENCGFVLWVGSKRLLKRRRLELYLAEAYSV